MTERELKLEQSKTQGAHRLIGLLEEHVRNPRDLVIKARIYDEVVAKIGGVTALKLIHICVDYSTRMETILAEMRVLFDSRNRFFRGSPIPLERFRTSRISWTFRRQTCSKTYSSRVGCQLSSRMLGCLRQSDPSRSH